MSIRTLNPFFSLLFHIFCSSVFKGKKSKLFGKKSTSVVDPLHPSLAFCTLSKMLIIMQDPLVIKWYYIKKNYFSNSFVIYTWIVLCALASFTHFRNDLLHNCFHFIIKFKKATEGVTLHVHSNYLNIPSQEILFSIA